MFERPAADYWMPVDQYIGGIEHAVLHLLYARFYTKVLRDLGLIKVDEPFQRAAHARAWSSRTAPRCRSPRATSSIPTTSSGTFGADTARLFSLFAAPPEKDLDWNDHGVEGASRFLNRVWRFVETHHDELTSAPSVSRAVERLSALPRANGGSGALAPPTSYSHDGGRNGVSADDPRDDQARHGRHRGRLSLQHGGQRHHGAGQRALRLRVGRRASACRPRSGAGLLREAIETTILLLGPFCPHVTEELWQHLGHRQSVFEQPWPVADPAALARREVTVVLQVDGKVRGRLTVEIDAPEERVRSLALADERVQPWLQGRALERTVVVANRLVNIVTRA